MMTHTPLSVTEALTDTPDLIAAVQQKRLDAVAGPADADLARFWRLRDLIPRGKVALIDNEHYNKPLADEEWPDFERKMAKWLSWVHEYESLVYQLAPIHPSVRDACRCIDCGGLVLVIWCEKCASCLME